MKDRWLAIQQWIKTRQGHAATLALVAGFVLDNLTLQRIDRLFENLIFAAYLFLIAASILLVQFFEARPERGRLAERVRLFLPLVIQFSLGNVFSGFFVFYSRSGSLVKSWPFLLFLVAIMIGNEVLKRYYERLILRVALLFVALYSFLIFLIPVLVGRMGPLVFVVSGAAAVIVIGLFGYTLLKLVPERQVETKRMMIGTISVITVLINILYFANILPPVPLSLKDAGIYHRVVRESGDYQLIGGAESWWQKLYPYQRVPLSPNRMLYAFSSVFAPTKLSTTIVHHWQYYDEAAGQWITAGRIPFAIEGGRDIGYRGYTVKSGVFPGWWRVDVETARGQIIGRIKFKTL